MDRLRVRMELLCMQAVSYEFSVQSHWERYLVSHILNRFKRHLKQRYITIRDDHHKLSEIENKLTQIRIRDNHQPNKGTLWELTSFPSVKWPEIYGANSSEWWDAYYELCPIVQSNVPEYPDDIKEPFAELDVLSYLSRSDGELIRRKGDRVALNQETFKGKWVWVCCFHVPFLYRGCVDFYPLINLCRELYSTKASDFEMVVVARMNGLANTRDVFDYFFSGFPESCLAVPFEDDRKRDNICKVLGLGNVYNSCKSLFLNEERQVLERFWSYGADVFPFTKDMLDTKRRKFNDIINKKFVDGLRLKDVLIGCNKVCKFESRGDILDISNLGDKHVGLYLCSNGRLAPYLWNMWLKCREESKEFEVVVVYMPNFTSIAEPEKVDGWLQECSISGWWILPFNYSVSCWLEELTHRYSCYESFTGEIDKLVMVGPEVDCLEMHAGDVMLHQGIEAFPFTVAAGVKAAKRKVEGVTLKSLFVDGVTFFRGEDSKDTKTLHELVNGGKKIVVCIDLLYKCHTNNYPNESWDWELEFGKLASAYLRLGGESEMVFVEVGSEDKVADDVRQRYISKMPWYVCPRDGVNSSNAEELSRFLFTDVSEGCTTQGAVIGFGKDGQLCSYSRKEYLPLDDKDGSIFFTPLDVEILLGYNKF